MPIAESESKEERNKYRELKKEHDDLVERTKKLKRRFEELAAMYVMEALDGLEEDEGND